MAAILGLLICGHSGFTQPPFVLPTTEQLRFVGPNAATTSPAEASAPASVNGNSIPESRPVLAPPAAAEDDAVVENMRAGELVAIVGNQHVLAGDLLTFIQPYLDANSGKITPEQETQLLRQVLVKYVEIKATYQEFFRDMAGNKPPKEVADMEKKIKTKAREMFYEKQAPTLFAQYKVDDLAALERKLREKSSSLHAVERQFIEQILSNELIRKYVPKDFDFGRDELLARYNADAEKWNVAGKARWRELCVRFSKHDPVEAEKLIVAMWNEVVFGGKPFEEVARDSSEGFTADKGGFHDWTTQGSLKSVELDQAIFTYEPNRISPIIKDELGLHVIEVLERVDAHVKTFAEAQPEIKKQLTNEKRSQLNDEFMTKVMAKTPIWTLWPEDIPGSRPLSDVIGN